jgi:hypothetical protein
MHQVTEKLRGSTGEAGCRRTEKAPQVHRFFPGCAPFVHQICTSCAPGRGGIRSWSVESCWKTEIRIAEIRKKTENRKSEGQKRECRSSCRARVERELVSCACGYSTRLDGRRIGVGGDGCQALPRNDSGCQRLPRAAIKCNIPPLDVRRRKRIGRSRTPKRTSFKNIFRIRQLF